MLLKTITVPNQILLEAMDLDITFMSGDQAVESVNKIREEWLIGKDILPIISHESVRQLFPIWDLYRVCPETKQIGNFAGDTKLPHNCVAVLIHKPHQWSDKLSIEYITSDMEAYIISDTGVTVSVINGKKAVEGVTIKGNGQIAMHGDNFKINSPQVDLKNTRF